MKRKADDAGLVPNISLPVKMSKKDSNVTELGLTKQESASLNLSMLKKSLKAFDAQIRAPKSSTESCNHGSHVAIVRSCAYELQATLEIILAVGVGKKLAFLQCQEAMCKISASWRELCDQLCGAISSELTQKFFDVCVELQLPWGGKKTMYLGTGPVEVVCGYVWRMLLRAWANVNVSDPAIAKAVREAVGSKVKLIGTKDEDVEDFEGHFDLYENGEWKFGPLTYVPLSTWGKGPCSQKLDELVVNRDNWELHPNLNVELKKWKEESSLVALM